MVFLSLFTRQASFIVLVLFSLSFPSILCARNVTVDDKDLSIKYSEGWESSPPGNSLNFGGSHHLADEKHADATAEFNFTGNAVFLMSPRWPYRVGVQVSVDGTEPVPVDLKDPDQTSESGGPETVNSTVLWSSGELANGTHALRISFLPGMQFAALDAIIFTVSDDTDTEKSEGSANISSDSTPPNTNTTMSDEGDTGPSFGTSMTRESLSDKTIVAIAIGSLLGTALIAFLIFLVAILLRRRRRAKKAPSDDFRAGSPYRSPPNANIYPQPPMAASWGSSLTRVATAMSDSSGKKGYGLSESEPAVVHISMTTERDGLNAAEKGERKSSPYPNPWRTSGPIDQSYNDAQNPFSSHAQVSDGNTTPPRTLTEVMDARSYFSHVRNNSISDDMKATAQVPARNPLPQPPAAVRALPVPK